LPKLALARQELKAIRSRISMRCPTLSELPPPPAGRAGWPWTEESPQLPDTMPDGRPWPRVSIVTPSYNQAQFIEETIRSVLLQGYPDLEYIIIDGGSTDGSAEIIRKYAPWLAYWVSEPDRGQSHAINKGWSVATGDWLGWLNADDIYLPGVLHRISMLLADDAPVDLVYGDVQYVDNTGKLRDINIKSEFSLRDMIMRGGLIHTPAVFWRRSLNDVAGPLDENQHYAMDNDFWLRVAPHARCRYLPGAMGTFRRHEGSKTVNSELALVSENLAIHRRRLAEAPYVTLLTRQEANMILGGFLWQMGVLLARTGREDEAIQCFRDAIHNYHIMDTPEIAALRTVKKLLENHVLERNEIDRILQILPLDEKTYRWFSAVVWDQYWQVQFYGGFQRGEARRVLRSALPLVKSNPRRAVQRGFLSICIRSLIAFGKAL
jgi:glycosyltransferase involved in cell wall biosynthesis